MKVFINTLAMCVLLAGGALQTAFAGDSEFCLGFQRGFIEGRPDAPMAPFCPDKMIGIQELTHYELGVKTGRQVAAQPGFSKKFLSQLPAYPDQPQAMGERISQIANWPERTRFVKGAVITGRIPVKPAQVSERRKGNDRKQLPAAVAAQLEKHEQWWGVPDDAIYITVFNPTTETVHGIGIDFSDGECASDQHPAGVLLALDFAEPLAPKQITTYRFNLPLQAMDDQLESCLIITQAFADGVKNSQMATDDANAAFMNRDFSQAVKILQQKLTALDVPVQQQRQWRHALGIVLSYQGRYNEAAEEFGKAFALGEQHRGVADPQTIASAAAFIKTLNLLGQRQRAIALRERVLDAVVRQAGQGSRDREIIFSWTDHLIEDYLDQNLFDKAEARTEKFIDQALYFFGPKKINGYQGLHKVIYTFDRRGRNEEAVRLYRILVQRSEQHFGENTKEFVGLLHNLGTLMLHSGRASEALAINERASQLYEKQHGAKGPEAAIFLDILGRNYGLLGRYEDKLRMHQQALAIHVEQHGEKNKTTSNILSSLYAAHFYLNQYPEAMAVMQRQMRLDNELLDPDDPEHLSKAQNLVALLQQMGKYKEANALLEKLVRLRIQVQGERANDTLITLLFLADSLSQQKQPAEALKIYQKILALSESEGDDTRLVSLKALFGIVKESKALGNKAEAIAAADRYIAAVEKLRAEPGLSVENRQAIFRKYDSTYRAFALMKATDQSVAEGFRLTELTKARTLLETMVAGKAQKQAYLPAPAIKKLEQLQARLSENAFLLAQTDNFDQKQSIERDRNRLTRELNDYENQLRRDYPKYDKLNQINFVTAPELARRLPSHTAAISYLFMDPLVVAFVIDASGEATFHPLAYAQGLTPLIEVLRKAYSGLPLQEQAVEDGIAVWQLADGSLTVLDRRSAPPAGAKSVADADAIAAYLAQQLLAPLEARLRGKRHWIIAPDGPLAFLPFDALPWGAAGKRVLEQVDVHYVQSMSVYALAQELQRSYQSIADRRQLFAMGNPEYLVDESSAQQRGARRRNAPTVNADKLNELDPLWQPLPGTEKEVRRVAALFPDSSAVYVGAQATESRLQGLSLQGELRQYRYLLFSAHGYLSADQPALSSIVLGLKQKSPGADGYVTATEWPAYDLRSDLTVLSACDSGAGKLVSGEGVLGLPFALFVAGNVNTILTLWPIDDQATATFMEALFSKLRAGDSAAAALAKTKREFMRDERYRDPRYWAPFVLVGAG